MTSPESTDAEVLCAEHPRRWSASEVIASNFFLQIVHGAFGAITPYLVLRTPCQALRTTDEELSCTILVCRVVAALWAS